MHLAWLGAVLIFCGIILTGVQLYVSIRQRERTADLTGDPWNGRTLEWATPSPPPAWNFSLVPHVERSDAFWGIKQALKAAGPTMGQRGSGPAASQFQPLHVPANTPVGFLIAFCAVLIGFSLIWHIFWLALVGLAAAVAIALWQAWKRQEEMLVPVEEITAFEKAHPHVGQYS